MKYQSRCLIGISVLLVALTTGCGHDGSPSVSPPPTDSQPQAINDAPFGPSHRTEAIALATKLAKGSARGHFDVRHPMASFATVMVPSGSRNGDVSSSTSSSTLSPCWLISFPIALEEVTEPAADGVPPAGPENHPIETPKVIPDTPLYAGGQLVTLKTDPPPGNGLPPSIPPSSDPGVVPNGIEPPRPGLPTNGSSRHIMPPGVLSHPGGVMAGSSLLVYIKPDGETIVAHP